MSVISEKDRNAPPLDTWEERLREEMSLAEGAPQRKASADQHVDTALQAREESGNQSTGTIGAGFMGHGLLNQIVNSVPGERLVAVYNRHLEKAIDAYRYAGLEPVTVESQNQLEDESRGVGPPSPRIGPFSPGRPRSMRS